MPFDLGPATAAALAAALFGAAYVRGYSGFGFSAIFIAFAALLTNPLPFVPVVFACEITMTAFQARGIRGHIDWRRVLWLLGGAAVALPFSVWAMLSVGPEVARIAVSAIVLVMSLILMSGWQLTKPIAAKGNAGVGMLSGLCNSAGVGGLPVAAFLTAQPIAPATFRATMIVYLTGLDILTLPLFYAGGLVTWDTALAATLAFPLLGLGVWLGGKQFTRASPTTFRRFAVALLMTLALIGLTRAAVGA